MQDGTNLFADPQIHINLKVWKKWLWFIPSEARQTYGCGNLGAHGIASWKGSHICSDLCKSLNLPHIKDIKVAIDNTDVLLEKRAALPSK